MDRTLRIVAAQRPPLVYIRGEGADNGDFSGMLVDLLPQLLEAANITRPYKLYNLGAGGGGSLLANGTWTGVMGELTRGRADMALFPLTLTSLRQRYITATVPYLDAGYALLVRQVVADTSYSFLLPFRPGTWLLLLAALASVILALSLLDAATRRARHRALARYYGVERAARKRRRERAMEYATESVFMLMGQGSPPNSRAWSVRVLFVCWCVFSIIMLSAYTANLTANLTVSRLDSTLRSLGALKRSGQMFGVPADSSVVRYFRESRDGLASSLLPAMVEYRNQTDAVAAVRAGRLGAYVTDWPVLKGLASEPPCDLDVTDDVFGPGQLVIGLRQRSPMEGPLSDALLRLSEGGVLSDLRRKWFVDLSSCAAQAADSKDAQASASSLSVRQVYPVFALLAGGMCLAALWAVLEALYFRHAWRHVKDLHRSTSLRDAVGRISRTVSGVLARAAGGAHSPAGAKDEGFGGGGGASRGGSRVGGGVGGGGGSGARASAFATAAAAGAGGAAGAAAAAAAAAASDGVRASIHAESGTSGMDDTESDGDSDEEAGRCGRWGGRRRGGPAVPSPDDSLADGSLHSQGPAAGRPPR